MGLCHGKTSIIKNASISIKSKWKLHRNKPKFNIKKQISAELSCVILPTQERIKPEIKDPNNISDNLSSNDVNIESESESVQTSSSKLNSQDGKSESVHLTVDSPVVYESININESNLFENDYFEDDICVQLPEVISVNSITSKQFNPSISCGHEKFVILGSPSTARQSSYDNKKQDKTDYTYTHTWLKTNIGYSCRKGLKPESPNQDNFFIYRSPVFSMYGVFDGHGVSGHDISNFVHCHLPHCIISDPFLEDDPVKVLKRSFSTVNDMLKELATSSTCIDCSFSGTTAIIALVFSNVMYFAHVGDSRGVMAKKTQSGSLEAIQLTSDHKPTREDELKRIEAKGGEVKQLYGDIPHRVFIKKKPYPGLAMSRAFGDFVGSTVGVISEPEISKIEITPQDQFMILGSDGIWEFIANKEAVDMVSSQPNIHIQEITELISREAWNRWTKEENNIVDDITCIIIPINGKFNEPK